MMVG